MPTRWMRAVEVYVDGVVLADRLAQNLPCYRLTRGVILDTLFGKQETLHRVT